MRPRAPHLAALMLLTLPSADALVLSGAFRPVGRASPPRCGGQAHEDSQHRRSPRRPPDGRGGRRRRSRSALPTTLAMVPFEVSLPSLLSPEAVLEPLNSFTEPWLRSVVWTDFRLAVALFVVAPLVLLGWSVASCRPPSLGGDADRPPSAEVALRYLTSYWQASSLLLITVALNIQESPLGVATGLLAQAIIAVSLWWWSDLNAEIDGGDSPGGSKASTASQLIPAFEAWRVAATAAAVAGVLVQVPFQPCVAVPSLVADAACAPWLEPPMFAAGLVGVGPSPALDLAANGFCALYFAILVYYLAVLLPSVGRRGRAPRPRLMDLASPIGVWRALGFIGEQTPASDED